MSNISIANEVGISLSDLPFLNCLESCWVGADGTQEERPWCMTHFGAGGRFENYDSCVSRVPPNERLIQSKDRVGRCFYAVYICVSLLGTPQDFFAQSWSLFLFTSPTLRSSLCTWRNGCSLENVRKYCNINFSYINHLDGRQYFSCSLKNHIF